MSVTIDTNGTARHAAGAPASTGGQFAAKQSARHSDQLAPEAAEQHRAEMSRIAQAHDSIAGAASASTYAHTRRRQGAELEALFAHIASADDTPEGAHWLVVDEPNFESGYATLNGFTDADGQELDSDALISDYYSQLDSFEDADDLRNHGFEPDPDRPGQWRIELREPQTPAFTPAVTAGRSYATASNAHWVAGDDPAFGEFLAAAILRDEHPDELEGIADDGVVRQLRADFESFVKQAADRLRTTRLPLG